MSSFSCYLIGEETLLIQCAEILLAQGQVIYGIVSPDTIVREWAKEHHLPSINPDEDILLFMQTHPFDYLFSIINGTILPPELLTLPRRWAINYHDSPLPRYAGNYATSWAILNQETQHAISWHIMVDKVDAGDILQQWPVEITPHETALTLNAKCYDAAIQAFRQLADDLAHQRVMPQPQDLTHRTFFKLYQRPPQGGVIAWQDPAEQIYALWRGLQFGTYRNELTTPKLYLAGQFFIVTQLSLTPARHAAPPGTVMAASDRQVTVATPTQWVNLHQLTTLTGQIVPLNHLNLAVGQTLPPLPLAQALTEKVSQLCRHEAYWVKQLSQLDPLTVPYAQTTLVETQPVWETWSLSLPPETIEAIQTDYDSTLFFIAASLTYLARLSGQAHFDVGLTWPQSTAWPHFFAPQVPFKVTLLITYTFNDIYQFVQTQLKTITQKESYTQDITSRYPQLAYYRQAPLYWPIVLQTDPMPIETPHSDFIIQVSPHGVQWRYNSLLFDPAHLPEMERQFTTLLHYVLRPTQNETFFWNLPLLSDPEQQRILVDWNQTTVTYPQACIHQLFEQQAAQTPTHLAVVMPTTPPQTLTYQQLNEQANQLAYYLQQLGVGPECCVGICLERSPELIVAVLAVLKAGGAYVPLNPQLPPERLAFMVNDLTMTWVITQTTFKALLPPHLPHLICLDEVVLAATATANLNTTVQPDNLVYIIYTSGSTGQPKGVMLNHSSLVNAYYAWEEAYQLRRYPLAHLQMANFSFDVFSGDWTRALCSGGQLILCPHEILLDPPALYDLMRRYAIQVAEFVPAVFRNLQLYLTETQQDLAFMCILVVASDNWYVQECQHILQLCGPETRLINSYGLTEAAVDSTYFDCQTLRHEPLAKDRLVPIGRPFANTQVYILNHYFQPVPVGLKGELYIGGAGLARGYFHQPDLTQQRFIANPFDPTSATRLYKTGDLARYLPNGHIEFLGRLDHQIKLRGLRIELGEIETLLHEHPALQSVIVHAPQDAKGELILVAYFISQQTPPPTAAELRAYLAERLPHYMIPAAFIQLTRFPLNTSGKINRRALPMPTQGDFITQNYVAPRTATEQLMAEIWAKVLVKSHISLNDNFFELGGHSLLATKLMTWLEKSFQLKLPLRILFENPTLAQLTQAMLEYEPQPGHIAKVADLYQRVKSMSSETVLATLQAKKQPVPTSQAQG